MKLSFKIRLDDKKYSSQLKIIEELQSSIILLIMTALMIKL